MNSFKRFCCIVFVLASVLGVGALVVVWLHWQPLDGYVSQWMDQLWFLGVEMALLGISAFGLLVVLVRAVFARGVRSNLEVVNDYGSIRISRMALERTVEHTVELHPDLTFIDAGVRVYNGRQPGMVVRTEVIPHGVVALDEYGAALQSEVKAAVEKFTGKEVRRVLVDFREENSASGGKGE